MRNCLFVVALSLISLFSFQTATAEISPAAPEQLDTVRVQITSRPKGAMLSINGRSRGETPFSDKLVEGDYVVVIVAYGYETYLKQIHIDPYHARFNIKLHKILLERKAVYLSGGYRYGNYIGYSAQAGVFFSGINVEGNYSMPQTEDRQVYWLNDPEMGKTPSTYILSTYHLESEISGKIGYGFQAGKRLRITPQVGAGVSSIFETDVESDVELGGKPQKTYVVSAIGGARTELVLFPHVALFASPEYTYPVMMGKRAEQINQNNTLISDWCKGFNIKAGIELLF